MQNFIDVMETALTTFLSHVASKIYGKNHARHGNDLKQRKYRSLMKLVVAKILKEALKKKSKIP